MKKFKLFVKLNSVTSILLLLLSCELTKKDNSMKIDWLQTESAYSIFPMMISEGEFIDDQNSHFLFQKNKLAFNGWANIGSTNIIDFKKKKIPVQINLKWFSLIEDKSFEINEKLDRDKVNSILSHFDTVNERFYFIVGMAPKGMLYLWIKSNGITELVQTFQARQIDKEWRLIFPEITMTKEIFISKTLEQILTKQQVDSSKLILNSIGNIWKDRNINNFGIDYSFEAKSNIDNMTVLFFNGEFNLFDFKANKVNAKIYSIKSIPKSINLFWREKNLKLNLELNFDEFEIFKSIEKLSNSSSNKLSLIINILKADEVKVTLKNEREYYEFSKFKSRLMSY